MRRTPSLALTLAIGAGTALAVTACRVGTDVEPAEPDVLEQAEAEAVLGALVLVSLERTVFSDQQVLFTHAHGPLGVHAHPIGGPFTHGSGIPGPLPSGHNLFNADFEHDVPCAGGGSLFLEAAAVGEGNPLTQKGFIDYQMGHELRECVVEVEALGGARLLLTTPPYVTGEASVRYDGASQAEIDGFLEGGFGWEGAAKAGACDLSVDFSAAGTTVLAIDQIQVTGTVCDFEVDRSYPRF
jgi:hypothetical protein